MSYLLHRSLVFVSFFTTQLCISSEITVPLRQVSQLLQYVNRDLNKNEISTQDALDHVDKAVDEVKRYLSDCPHSTELTLRVTDFDRYMLRELPGELDNELMFHAVMPRLAGIVAQIPNECAQTSLLRFIWIVKKAPEELRHFMAYSTGHEYYADATKKVCIHRGNNLCVLSFNREDYSQAAVTGMWDKALNAQNPRMVIWLLTRYRPDLKSEAFSALLPAIDKIADPACRDYEVWMQLRGLMLSREHFGDIVESGNKAWLEKVTEEMTDEDLQARSVEISQHLPACDIKASMFYNIHSIKSNMMNNTKRVDTICCLLGCGAPIEIDRARNAGTLFKAAIEVAAEPEHVRTLLAFDGLAHAARYNPDFSILLCYWADKNAELMAELLRGLRAVYSEQPEQLGMILKDAIHSVIICIDKDGDCSGIIKSIIALRDMALEINFDFKRDKELPDILRRAFKPSRYSKSAESAHLYRSTKRKIEKILGLNQCNCSIM